MTPQNNIPPDMDALLAWLKEQALEAHNHCVRTMGRDVPLSYGYAGQSIAFNRVIAKIENSRVNQRIHISEKV